jgi:tetratricopeptide (TPR) repeat protein
MDNHNGCQMVRTPPFRLWTPVANAWEAYRRRLISDQKSTRATYEHIWRLIHIEEALTVMLGAALASRLLDCWRDLSEKSADLGTLRGMVTGVRVGESSNPATFAEHCLKGSIAAWTDVLNRFGKPEANRDCPFCSALANYLNEEVPESIAFLDVWKRIAPVSDTYFAVRSRIGRLQAINAFRNKIAHVPIPEKLLSGIHKGLRKEILSMLTTDKSLISSDAMSDLETTKWHAVLKGKLGNCDGCVSGSAVHASMDGVDDKNVKYIWHNADGADQQATNIQWSATPFVRLDGELKVLLLFRIDGLEDPDEESFAGEYHRFSAESEPVQQQIIRNDEIRPWIPPRPTSPAPISPISPSSPEQTGLGGSKKRESGKESRRGDKTPGSTIQLLRPPLVDRLATPDELRDLGERFFRDRLYADAVSSFEALQKTGDDRYNDVAKLRHGSALWRVAERDIEDHDKRIEAIEQAIALLIQATHHRDLKYRALSYYQLSKAQWHLWRYRQNDQKLLDDALANARNAAKLDYDPTYMSWHDRLGKVGAEARKAAQELDVSPDVTAR